MRIKKWLLNQIKDIKTLNKPELITAIELYFEEPEILKNIPEDKLSLINYTQEPNEDDYFEYRDLYEFEISYATDYSFEGIKVIFDKISDFYSFDIYEIKPIFHMDIEFNNKEFEDELIEKELVFKKTELNKEYEKLMKELDFINHRINQIKKNGGF